ncbi:hypothetical protein [Longilinea arvoryzae]|uniref:hypothetical protein n=1 Tax=Longilinea arvoryzae TaxID=360412 RepID=UPI0012602C66|nr:hypothetical protein [Longilinea arvoryzae]
MERLEIGDKWYESLEYGSEEASDPGGDPAEIGNDKENGNQEQNDQQNSQHCAGTATGEAEEYFYDCQENNYRRRENDQIGKPDRYAGRHKRDGRKIGKSHNRRPLMKI